MTKITTGGAAWSAGVHEDDKIISVRQKQNKNENKKRKKNTLSDLFDAQFMIYYLYICFKDRWCLHHEPVTC